MSRPALEQNWQFARGPNAPRSFYPRHGATLIVTVPAQDGHRNATLVTLPSRTDEYYCDIAPRTFDREEIGRLFTMHQRFVTAIARGVLGPDDADDGVQEVFLRLASKPVTYRGQSTFRTWLYRVTVNTCLNMARARARRWDRTAPLNLVEDTPTRAHPLFTTLELSAAIATLSPIQRRVLLLHDWEGYKHSEVGRKLDMPEGTSKSRLSKARRAVRRVMDED